MGDTNDPIADVVYRAELLEDLGTVTVMGRQYVAADLLTALMAGAAARELRDAADDWDANTNHICDAPRELRDRARALTAEHTEEQP